MCEKKKCFLVFCCAEHEGEGIQNACVCVWSGCLISKWSYRHRHTHTVFFISHSLTFHCKGQNQIWSQNWGKYVLLYLWRSHPTQYDHWLSQQVMFTHIWAPDYKCTQHAAAW